MEFGILGPLEVRAGQRVVDLKGRKLRILLAALVVDAGRVVSTDRLVHILWGPDPPDAAAATLQSHIAHLRDALEPERRRGHGTGVIVTQDPGYVLAVDPDQVDAGMFERLAGEGRRALAEGAPGEAAVALSRALELWRGDPLAEFTYEPFAQAEIVRLTELRIGTVEDRVAADLALGRHGELTAELRSLVGEHPLRERLWSYLILALYRSGRQSEALRACGELREILREQLGLEPSPEIARLEEDVLLQKAALDWQPPRETDGGCGVDREEPKPELASNVPLQLTSFVGRTEEIAAARRAMSSTRLLTLTGTGGVGKTRMAVEIAGQVLAEGRQPVLFVELAPFGDAPLVAKRVASALQVPEEPGVPVVTTLARHIGDAHALLVLDNCEHLLPTLAHFAETLLLACPRLRVLATSREPLRVAGETVWRVPSLSVPPAVPDQSIASVTSSESARLFLDRARAAGGVAQLSKDEAQALARICQRLEGIPLALELAAARTTFLTLSEMADLLADRFRLLSVGTRTGPSRHRTLRAAVDWTYETLSPPERLLFSRLSVFSGGFALDSAAFVCAGEDVHPEQVMELIASLVDKSLVSAERHGRRARYRILETLRQYGAERLAESGEDEVSRHRHVEWVCALVEDCEPRLWGPHAAAALDDLEEELDNVREALRRAHQAGLGEVVLRLTGGLVKFWRLRGYFLEARSWLEVAVAASPAPSLARAKALLGLGSLALLQADHEAAERWLGEALATCQELGDEVGMAEAQTFMGTMALMKGDMAAAASLYELSLAGWRRSGELRGVGISLEVLLHNMGELAYEQGDLDLAVSRFEESIDVSRRLGVTVPLIHPLIGLGQIASDRGDRSSARALYEESLEIARRFGYRRGEAGSLQYLARLTLAEGDVGHAARAYREALEVWSGVGDKLGVAWCLEGLASVAAASGELTRTAVLLAAADGVREAIDTPVAPSERSGVDDALAVARAGLEGPDFAAAWERGRSSPLEAVVGWALGEEDPEDLSGTARRPIRALS